MAATKGNYYVALANFQNHNFVAARAYIHRARDENRSGGNAACGGDALCHDINALYARIDPEQFGRIRDHDKKAVAADRNAILSAMSRDQREVYEDEGETGPCHKEFFQSAGVQRVTWWYCDDGGHYRKAYSFTNGVLTSTYAVGYCSISGGCSCFSFGVGGCIGAATSCRTLFRDLTYSEYPAAPPRT